jgi:hypothetical protein
LLGGARIRFPFGATLSKSHTQFTYIYHDLLALGVLPFVACSRDPAWSNRFVWRWPTRAPIPSCAPLRSQGGHKHYFDVVGYGYFAGGRSCFRSRVPSGFGGWCREGQLNPQGTKYRRILRESESLTLQYHQLLLSASDAVSRNIELPPIPFQVCRLRPVPVTTASKSANQETSASAATA